METDGAEAAGAHEGTGVTTEAVLDAALGAFADRGYDGTSVREISRSLGVSHNTIPKRIGNKEQLWFAAIDRGFGLLAAALAEAIEEHDADDDLARLRILVVRFIEANALRPELLRIITQEASTPGPRVEHIFTAYIDPVRAFGDDLLRRLRSQGVVHTDSVSLLYFFMTHGAGGPLALPWLAQRFGAAIDPDDDAAIRAHAEAAADLIFRGLVRGEANQG